MLHIKKILTVRITRTYSRPPHEHPLPLFVIKLPYLDAKKVFKILWMIALEGRRLSNVNFQEHIYIRLSYRNNQPVKTSRMRKTIRRKESKILIDNTFCTASDLQMSRDSSISSYQAPETKRAKKEYKAEQKEEQSEVFSDYNLMTADMTMETQREDEQEGRDEQNEAQVKLEDDDKYSESDVSCKEEGFIPHRSIQADLSQMSTQKDEEDNHVYEETPLSNGLTEEDLRKNMKDLDDQIRTLNAMKNRLKYQLRLKEGTIQVGECEPTPMKQCKCCNKDISKLCFRCEHIYCKVEECARKKKQVLNARMLIKMREKKVGEPRNLKRNQLREKKERKREEGVELSSVEEEPSFDSNCSEESLSTSTNEPPRTHPKPKPIPSQNQPTLPDISSTSFLNMSISNKSELYFEE